MKAGAQDLVLKRNLSRLIPAIERELRESKARRINGEIEEKLEMEQSMLDDFLSNSLDAIYFKNIDHIYIRANAAEARILNAERVEDVIGKSAKDFVTLDRAKMREEEEDEIFATGRSIIDRQEMDPQEDGTVRWYSANKVPVRDHSGKIIGLVGVTRNITERKAAERRLQDSEERFRSLIDNLPSFINLKDIDGHFQLFNQKHSEIFDVEDSLNKRSSDIHSKELAEEVFIQERKVIETKSSVTQERHSLTKQGACDFLVTKFPIIDESGAVTGIGTIGTDITDRKQVEDRIKASLDEKEVLLKEIHHRVKNNLTVISAMLGMQADGEEDAHAVEVLQDSHRRVMLMAQIHESLYRQDNVNVIDASDFLNTLVTNTKASGGVVSEHLSFQVDVDDISLDVDHANAYGQIVSELISNCQKHGFANGDPGNIEVSLHQSDDGGTELTVSDDGKGMPEDFDIEKAKSLGMKLVYALSAKLGGKVKIDGTNGTRVQVTFPENPS